MRRSVLALIVAITTLLSFTSISAAAPAGGTTRAIVVLSDAAGNPSQAAAAFGRQYGFTADLVYSHALRGFAAEVPSGRLDALRADPRVAYVELDQVARIYDQTVPTGIQRIFADENTNIDIDGTDDRVDVDVAVIDTGIDLDHPDLNVFRSVNCSGGSPFKQSCGSGGDDDNNHGTHVAGTIGALDNGFGVVGVAPGARLWAVKVLRSDGSGYISWIIAGIDYVTANKDSIEVANMSLGCECSSSAMDSAIANSVAAGVVYAVAAGNSDKDAATFSPANHPDVVTVSALADFDGALGGSGSPTCRSDQDDTLADFSNWGNKIEIAAPGVCILSTVPGGYATYSGTSMASPHVAGAAALLASKNNPSNKTDVENIRSTLINNGNFNWIDDSGDGIKEPLLDVSNTTVFDPVLIAGSGGGGGNTAPVANDDAYTTTEGQPLNVPAPGVLGNDNDVDGEALTAIVVTNVSNGALILNLDGSFSYTSNTGATSDSFQYKANDGTVDSNVATVTITVNPVSSGGTMHVGDLDGATSLKGKSGKWEAVVTVTIHDGSDDPVVNASVTATWSGGKSGTVTGTTGTNGTVSLATGAITGTSVTLTIDEVTHTSLGYESGSNHDPDGDSNGTSITVNRP
jgi:subtilisin family serine protease